MNTLLYSGGLDSACAWWILGKPAALHFNGPNGPARDASDGEREAIRRQVAICPEFASALRVAVLDFRPFMRAGTWQFPRDQICCITAWAHGCDSVALGWCKEDGLRPGDMETQKARLEASVGMRGFTVHFPVLHMTKAEMIPAALKAGAPMEFLEASHSCVRDVEPCGECNNCRHRVAAFESAQVPT